MSNQFPISFLNTNHINIKKISLIALVFSLLFAECRQHRADEKLDYSPKPRGYNRIDLPVNAYQPMLQKHPYSFEYSKYAVIKPDTFRLAEPHWIYVSYPQYKANIQLTYKPILGNKNRLISMIADAHKLAAKHQIKAYGIQEKIYKAPNGQAATIFELEGEVPSQYQFYLTDSTHHYLRGALYFETATANDSLAPIINYIKTDILHLINTTKWHN